MTQFEVLSFGLSPTTEWNRDLYASLAVGSYAGALNDSFSSSVVFWTIDEAADPRPNRPVPLDASFAASALWRECFDAPLRFVDELFVPFVVGVALELGVELLEPDSSSWIFAFFWAGGLSFSSLGEEELVSVATPPSLGGEGLDSVATLPSLDTDWSLGEAELCCFFFPWRFNKGSEGMDEINRHPPPPTHPHTRPLC